MTGIKKCNIRRLHNSDTKQTLHCTKNKKNIAVLLTWRA